MKASKYNYFIEIDEPSTVLAYNAISHGLCILERSIANHLEKEGNDIEIGLDSELIQQLRLGSFLLNNEYDELKMLKFRQNNAQYNNRVLSLTIAPTINCNLACPYCFESHVKGKMTRSVIHGIAVFVETQIQEGNFNEVSVTWYGGEPLLYPDVIESLGSTLIDICDKANVRYSADIITNGTKLTSQVSQMLRDNRVKNVQITLDGDKLHHDCRRVNKGGGGSFDQIMKNISESIGIIPITIRINVDRTNVKFGVDVLSYFRNQNWFNSKDLAFYFGWVRHYTENVDVKKSDVLIPEEFHKESESFKRELIVAGLEIPEMPSNGGSCVATNVNGYVIGPTGDMWKCWSSIGDKEKIFGNVLTSFEPNADWLNYMNETWESDEECRSCKVLPICMGGCSDVRINRNNGRIDHKDCGTWRYNLENKMIDKYKEVYNNRDLLNQVEDYDQLPFQTPIPV